MNKADIIQTIADRLQQKLTAKGIGPNAWELTAKQAFRFYDIHETDYLTMRAFLGAIERLGVWLDPREQSLLQQEIDPQGKDKIVYSEFIKRITGAKGIAPARSETESRRKMVTTLEEQRGMDFLIGRLRKICLLPVLGAFLKADSNRTGVLDSTTIRKVLMTATRYDFTDTLALILNRFDSDLNGKYEYAALLDEVVGKPSLLRQNFITQLFAALSHNKPTIQLPALIKIINASAHPDIERGIKSVTQAEQEIVDGLKILADYNPTSAIDFAVFSKFINYLSAPIDSDDYLKLVIEKIFGVKVNQDFTIDTKDVSVISDTYSQTEGRSVRSRTNRNLSVEPIIAKLKAELLIKGLSFTLSFIRILKSSESPKTKEIDFEAFKNAVSGCKVPLSLSEQETLFLYFRKPSQDSFNFDAFKAHLIPPLNSTRTNLIESVFKSFESTDRVKVRIVEVKRDYNPGVDSHAGPNESVYIPSKGEFDFSLDNYLFTVKNSSDFLNKEEFLDFYRFIGIFCHSDDQFEQIVRKCWKKINDNTQKQIGHQIQRPGDSFAYLSHKGDDSMDSNRHVDRSRISDKLEQRGQIAGVSSVHLNFKKDKQNRYQGFDDNGSIVTGMNTNRTVTGSTIDSMTKFIDLLNNGPDFAIFTMIAGLKKSDLKDTGVLDHQSFLSSLRTSLKPAQFDDSLVLDLPKPSLLKDNKIDYLALTRTLMATVQSQNLQKVVDISFKALDIYKKDAVSLEVVRSRFVPSSHPKVTTGRVADYQMHQNFNVALDNFSRFKVL